MRRAILENLKKLKKPAKKDRLETSVSTSLKNMLFDRDLFRYPLKYVCHYFFCCGKLRRIREKAAKSDIYRSHLLYKAGD